MPRKNERITDEIGSDGFHGEGNFLLTTPEQRKEAAAKQEKKQQVLEAKARETMKIAKKILEKINYGPAIGSTGAMGGHK